MTATLGIPIPVLARPESGGAPARRAVVRWAWRLFRREWRQQVLVVALIAVAEAATIIGAAVAGNTPTPVAATFGRAQDLVTLTGSGAQAAGEIASLRRRFGPVDVIENQTLAVPGSVKTFQLRAQDPSGPYGAPLLSLVSGHYPRGADQVVVTAGLASSLDLHAGAGWRVGGAARQVVGIVEDPQNLADSFALVPPGQVATPTQVSVLFDARGLPPDSIGPNVLARSAAGQSSVFNPETISLAGLTLGMVLIALVAVGGFTVLAQRRLRSLGMLAALGASDENVALVVKANGAVVGAVGSLVGVGLGVVAWLAYRPHLESSAGHVIGVWAVPWLVIGLAVVLGLVAAYFAASRPARSVTRVPIVAALSGRPAPPRRVHRSAVPGIAFLALAFLLLGYSGSQAKWGQSGGSMRALVLGVVALVPAVILLSPLCLSALARVGGRAPIAVRLALRDLNRYRARSGSALAAISLGILIAVIIAIIAAVRYGNALDYVGPNLASNQLVLYTSNLPGAPPGAGSAPTAGQIEAMAGTAHDVGALLGARDVLELDSTSASLQHAAAGRNWNGQIYVATPALLKAFGIPAAEINGSADILTRRPGISDLSRMQLIYGDSGGIKVGPGPGSGPSATRFGAGPGPSSDDFTCAKGSCLANPVIQEVDTLPSGTSAPNTLITQKAVSTLGLQAQTSGWLIQTPNALTSSQIDSARRAAARAGMSVESKNDQPTSDQVINLATLFGIALALAILAMSVGLIRSESAPDLRTLAATGASSWTRRTLTAATAGGLGLLGAVLGTVAGYVAVIGWLRTNSLNGGVSALGNVPVAQLLAIVVGMPVLASILGWLLAGREPPAVSHQPIE